MIVSIIPRDNTVYIEGETQTVSMDGMPDYVHAIQWNGVRGEVEFVTDEAGKRLPNLQFSDFAPFQFMVTRWEQRKAYLEEQAALHAEEQAAQLLAQQQAINEQQNQPLM